MHSFVLIDYFSLKLEIGLKVKETKGKDFSFKAFIKSEQLRRLSNDQNDWYNVLGSSEPYKFEPPFLEEESYASNNSFDGIKRERMIYFLYKWLLWKRRYIIEMNTLRNSFRKSLPHAASLFGFCCVRRAPLWIRMQIQNGIVIQSYYFKEFLSDPSWFLRGSYFIISLIW